MTNPLRPRVCHGCDSNTYEHCVYFIGILPFWSVEDNRDDDYREAVRVYWVERNMCNAVDADEPCSGEGNLYYTTETAYPDKGSVLCQRHWYETHRDPGAIRFLVEMTPREFAQQRGEATAAR